MIKNANGKDFNFFEVGDVFAVEHFKTYPNKFNPNKMDAKILTSDGDIVFTSAAKIVKALDVLYNDPEIPDLSKYTFEVVQVGEFNGFAVLGLKSDNPVIKKKLMKAFF